MVTVLEGSDSLALTPSGRDLGSSEQVKPPPDPHKKIIARSVHPTRR